MGGCGAVRHCAAMGYAVQQLPIIHNTTDLDMGMKIEIYYHDKPAEKIPVYKLIEIKPDTVIQRRGKKVYLVKEL